MAVATLEGYDQRDGTKPGKRLELDAQPRRETHVRVDPAQNAVCAASATGPLGVSSSRSPPAAREVPGLRFSDHASLAMVRGFASTPAAENGAARHTKGQPQ
jgi:hypothetical protein